MFNSQHSFTWSCCYLADLNLTQNWMTRPSTNPVGCVGKSRTHVPDTLAKGARATASGTKIAAPESFTNIKYKMTFMCNSSKPSLYECFIEARHSAKRMRILVVCSVQQTSSQISSNIYGRYHGGILDVCNKTRWKLHSYMT